MAKTRKKQPKSRIRGSAKQSPTATSKAGKRRASGRKGRPSQAAEDCCKRIEKRIQILEGLLSTGKPPLLLGSLSGGASVIQAPPVSVFGTRAGLGETVDVGLDKSEGSPDFVRISLDSDDSVIFMHEGEKEGAVHNAIVGSFVVVKIEVSGNPLQKATIKVAKAVPNIIEITVPASGGIVESQVLLITG